MILFPALLKFDAARDFSEALGNATTEQLTRRTAQRGLWPHQRTIYELPLHSPEEFADTPRRAPSSSPPGCGPRASGGPASSTGRPGSG